MSLWYEAISRAPDRETSQKLLLFWEVEVCRVNFAEKIWRLRDLMPWLHFCPNYNFEDFFKNLDFSHHKILVEFNKKSTILVLPT